MLDDVVEIIGFDDRYWDESVVFTKYEIEKHLEKGYELVRYVETYHPSGGERIYAELEKEGEKIIIFASPVDGLNISRIPVKTRVSSVRQ